MRAYIYKGFIVIFFFWFLPTVNRNVLVDVPGQEVDSVDVLPGPVLWNIVGIQILVGQRAGHVTDVLPIFV